MIGLGRAGAVSASARCAQAALGIADRGYVIETGSVILHGTGSELLANEQVQAAYLGM